MSGLCSHHCAFGWGFVYSSCVCPALAILNPSCGTLGHIFSHDRPSGSPGEGTDPFLSKYSDLRDRTSHPIKSLSWLAVNDQWWCVCISLLGLW